MPKQRAREYRAYAAVLREMAKESSDKDHKQSFLRTARYYENMAAELDPDSRKLSA